MSSPFDILDQKYPDIRFELYPNDKAKRVYLTGFIVPYTMRGQGVGSSFMNDLTKIADENGWTITLTPSSSYGGNVTRLKQFYKGFGFVENKGSNRDFSHREDMYRLPQGADALNEEIEKMRSTLLMLEKKSIGKDRDIKDKIKYVRGISDELKDFALSHLETYTNAAKGRISGLQLHPDLKKKIKEKGLPDGFSMGVDKDGYYIHTHRARSKSYEKPDAISVKDIKFIDSTG
jgi:predicted GNAT family acetyltransferase